MNLSASQARADAARGLVPQPQARPRSALAAFLWPPTVPLGISLPTAGKQGVSVTQFSRQPRDNTVGDAIEGIYNILIIEITGLADSLTTPLILWTVSHDRVAQGCHLRAWHVRLCGVLSQRPLGPAAGSVHTKRGGTSLLPCVLTSQPRRVHRMTLFLAQFSIEDLQAQPRQTTCWDGVRNYQVGGLAGP